MSYTPPLACLCIALVSIIADGQQLSTNIDLERVSTCDLRLDEAHIFLSNNVFSSQPAPQRLNLVLDTAIACFKTNRHAIAEPFLRVAISIQETALGSEHQQTLTLLSLLGTILEAKGDNIAAEQLFRHLYDRRLKHFGLSNKDTIFSLVRLASSLSRQGKYEEAEASYLKAVDTYDRTFGKNDPDLVLPLNNLAFLAERSGRYSSAEAYFRRALAINETARGSGHPATAISLNNLAALLMKTGSYADSVRLLKRAVSISEMKSGSDHPDTANLMNNLASALEAIGDLSTAESLLKKALTIREKVLGPLHRDTAISLNNLALLSEKKNDLASAETFARRAIAIFEDSSGSDHPDTATALASLGNVLSSKGDAASAEMFFRKSLAIKERHFGPNHPELVSSLNNLAVILMRRGSYSSAEVLFRRGLSLSEKFYGSQHAETASAMHNFAVYLATIGDYRTAERYYQAALSIREKVFGVDHPAIANSLGSLATLLYERGDYETADALCRRGLYIQEQNLGPDHPSLIPFLNLLAFLAQKKGQYETAEQALRYGISIREKTQVSPQDDYAMSLNNLAMVLTERGDKGHAEDLLRRALSIQETLKLPEDPALAGFMNNLAFLLYQKKDYDAAKALYLRAHGLEQRLLGPEHPKTVTILTNIAMLAWASGRNGEASEILARASDYHAKNLERWLVPPGENAQRGWIRTLFTPDILISLNRERPSDAATTKAALWALLQRTGRLQELRVLEGYLAKEQPQLFQRWRVAQQLADDCSSGKARRNNQPMGNPTPFCDGSHAERQTAANRAREELLRVGSSAVRDLGIVDYSDILSRLKDGNWVFLQIARYGLFRPHQEPQLALEQRYAAYLLFPDGSIHFRDLGPSDRIDKKIAKLRMLSTDPASHITSVRAAAADLHNVTLGLFDDLLERHTRIYVAAEGDLALIDLSLLSDKEGRWLVERHLIVNVTSGRDLVRLGGERARQRQGHGHYMVANPSFVFKNESSPQTKPSPARATKLGTPAFCNSVFGNTARWSSIGLTRRHVVRFSSALPGLKVLDRDQATESRVKQIGNPGTLWFITHGFFCEDSPTKSEGAGDQRQNWEDPMLRGALVLAGAQVGGVGDGEDGLLQSSEIVEREWAGTELVVLGACETALGVPHVGDGVYGMRRAFTLAGVRSQVMTLWQVGQAPTFEVLQTFADLLHRGKGKAEALREAQVQMLRKNEHPYYWAGFYFIGDPSPLSTAVSASPNRN